MKTYRVAINHRAGHLVVHKVEAASKAAAEQQVRSSYSSNGAALGRTSSITVVK